MKKELRVVVDTNIFIGALIGGSWTSPIVDAFIDGGFRLVISEILIKELRRTLNKPKITALINDVEALDLILFIRSKAEIITPLKTLEICRDHKDNIVLECASEAKVDFIVTGDDDLLVLKSFRNIPIVSPKEFLSHLRK